MIKMLPRAYENFAASFKLPKILPGGAHCMMNSINVSNVKVQCNNVVSKTTD